MAAAAQTSTDRNGSGQLDDDGGDGGEHTYPIVVADKKRRHLIDPFHLQAENECFCADRCV